MNNQILSQALGIPVGSIAYQAERTPKRLLQDRTATQYHGSSSPNGSPKLKQSKVDMTNKLGGKEDNLAYGIRDHVRLGPKISETVKGKLSLGAKILQAGGVENIFKRHFTVGQEEKLLKASQCYLSTTAGPIAGLFFISTDRIAFCSERSIKFSTPTGELIRIHYKVMIPVRKILRADESQNMKRPSRKYIEIVTVDNFDFWFMGFLNYRKTFKHLQQAISQAQQCLTTPLIS